MNGPETENSVSVLEKRKSLLSRAQSIYEQKKSLSNVRELGNRAIHGGQIVTTPLDADHILQLRRVQACSDERIDILPSLNLDVISSGTHTRERHYRLLESSSALIQWGYGEGANGPLITARHPEALEDISFLLSKFETDTTSH